MANFLQIDDLDRIRLHWNPVVDHSVPQSTIPKRDLSQPFASFPCFVGKFVHGGNKHFCVSISFSVCFFHSHLTGFFYFFCASFCQVTCVFWDNSSILGAGGFLSEELERVVGGDRAREREGLQQHDNNHGDAFASMLVFFFHHGVH